ncbi:MAG TPA: cyclic nucleotide-gated ion channel [Rhizomicrobium sp.]|nr:cyclic nucleotide-gated ion channel [Rhizomicrobium sp.]
MARNDRAKRRHRAAEPPRETLRRRLHRIMEAGHISNWGVLVFEASLITLILANVIAVMLDSVKGIGDRYFTYFYWFESVSIVIFAIEYSLRLWVCVEDPRYGTRGAFWGRVRYAFTPVMLIDFASFAPGIVNIFVPAALDLRILRLFRLLRLMKIARYSPALSTLIEVIKAERRALLGTLLLIVCVMVISAYTMYVVEGPVQPDKFGSLPSALYWAVTTLSTTGYGDITPVTAIGRLVAGVTMMLGLALFALPVGIVATNFVTEIHRRDFVVTWSMISHLPLFEDFSAAAVSDVMNVLRSRLVREHAQLTLAGGEGNEMFFIISGNARAEYERGSVSLGPGDFFGETTVLSTAPYDCTVVARSSMRVLTLSTSDFQQLTRKHPKLKRRFESVAARKGQKLEARARRQEGRASPEHEDLDLAELGHDAPADIE